MNARKALNFGARAPEDACTGDMLALIRWHGRNVAVPLSQLAAIDADESTIEAIGTLSDIITTLRYFSEDDFEAVLNDPPAGIFDRRSWTYWNVRYRHDPVPPLPKRTLP